MRYFNKDHQSNVKTSRKPSAIHHIRAYQSTNLVIHLETTVELLHMVQTNEAKLKKNRQNFWYEPQRPMHSLNECMLQISTSSIIELHSIFSKRRYKEQNS